MPKPKKVEEAPSIVYYLNPKQAQIDRLEEHIKACTDLYNSEIKYRLRTRDEGLHQPTFQDRYHSMSNSRKTKYSGIYIQCLSHQVYRSTAVFHKFNRSKEDITTPEIVDEVPELFFASKVISVRMIDNVWHFRLPLPISDIPIDPHTFQKLPTGIKSCKIYRKHGVWQVAITCNSVQDVEEVDGS